MPRTRRLESLTVARFYAALAVFVFHASLVGFFSTSGTSSMVVRTATQNLGNFGVTFFFALSGFVLTWSRRPDDKPGPFLMRRVVRLFPTHWATFLLALLLTGAGGAPPATVLSNAGLLHSWSANADTYFSVNFPSWSISSEMFFYAVFPLLARPLARLGPRGLARVLTGAVVGVALLPLITRLPVFASAPVFGNAFAASPVHGHSETAVWFLYVFPVTRCLDFVAGICLALLIMKGATLPRISLGTALAVLAGVYGLSVLAPLEWQLASLPLAAAIPLISATVQRDLRTPDDEPPGPARRVGIALGQASFAFYLLHEILLKAARRSTWPLSESGWIQGAVTAGVLAVAIAGAMLLHRYVEEPPIRRLRRVQHAPPPTPTPRGA